MREKWLANLWLVLSAFALMYVAASLAKCQEIVIKTPHRTVHVVKAFPVPLEVKDGGALYRWNLPLGTVGKANRNKLDVTAGPGGEITVSVEWIEIDFAKQAFQEFRKEITFYVGDVEPPNPPDPPVPPIPVGALRVIFVRESADSLTTAQDHAWNSSKIAAYLNEKCVKDGTHPAWRKWDKDVNKPAEVAAMKQLFEDAKAQLTSLPAVIVAVGQKALVYPIVGEDETLAILKKHAEGK